MQLYLFIQESYKFEKQKKKKANSVRLTTLKKLETSLFLHLLWIWPAVTSLQGIVCPKFLLLKSMIR